MSSNKTNTEEKKEAKPKKSYEKREFKREPKSENSILGRSISQEAISINEIDETIEALKEIIPIISIKRGGKR